MKILTLIILICGAVASASRLKQSPRGRGSAQAIQDANRRNDHSGSSSLSREEEPSGPIPDGQPEREEPPTSIAAAESKKKVTTDREIVAKIFKLFKYPFGNTVIVIITMVAVTLALVGLLKKEQDLDAFNEAEDLETETYYNQYQDYYNSYNHYNYNPSKYAPNNYSPNNYNPNYGYRSSKSPFNFSYRGMVDLAQKVYAALQKEY
ncbi:uncharacterized protein LOC135220295 [Macrobrachium nipponense]|uniref:uncharacterized protein LOC135220295 n=1 Tax=Macrobrachium nipponense TaxID=159736 RepID=UPI0030C7C54B